MPATKGPCLLPPVVSLGVTSVQETVCSVLAAHVAERLASGEPPPPLCDPASPAEAFLAGFPSLNPFSAAALLAAQTSLRRLVTLPPAERTALATAVPGMPHRSLELFYQQLEYGRRLLPAAQGMPQVQDTAPFEYADVLACPLFTAKTAK